MSDEQKKEKTMYIAVDFDGTIVEHMYPAIGKPVPYALNCMKALTKKGHKLILNTLRCGNCLNEAVEFLNKNGVELYGVNKNPDQSGWTDSPKVYAHIYIDDAGYGCPLIESTESEKKMVDWFRILGDSNLFDIEDMVEVFGVEHGKK